MNYHRVNVLDFGADPGGQKDSTDAFQQAINTIQDWNNGLIVEIPTGYFKLSRTLHLKYRIILKGPGTLYSTNLDFSDQKSGSGIVISGYGQAGIEGLVIKKTAGHGIEVKDSNELGGQRTFFYVQDVAVEDAGRIGNEVRNSEACGFFVKNASMSNFNRCWSRRAAKFGFFLAGFQASIKLDTCYASQSGDTGIYLNDTIYSSVINCRSTLNGKYGYFLSNCQSIVVSGCGAEDNYYSSIGMAATKDEAQNSSDADRSEIRGVTIQSFFSMRGNISNDGAFGHYLTLTAKDGKRITGSSQNHFALPTLGSSQEAIVKRGRKPEEDIRFIIDSGEVILENTIGVEEWEPLTVGDWMMYKDKVDDLTDNIRISEGRVGIGSPDPHQTARLNVEGDLCLGEGAEGNGNKLMLTKHSNFHYIRAHNWWTEFVSHSNEGWKFLDNDLNVKLLVKADSGHVGIGIDTPKAPLHVAGGAEINHILIGRKTTQLNYPWEYETIGLSSPHSNLRIQSPNSILFHTGIGANLKENEKKVSLAIAPNGRVGIGTENPSQELTVVRNDGGNVNLSLKNNSGHALDVFSGTTKAGLWSHGPRSLEFGTNGSGRMIIDQHGNVGIGNAAPVDKLHIAGGVTVEGNIKCNVLISNQTHKGGMLKARDTGNLISFKWDGKDGKFRIYVDNTNVATLGRGFHKRDN